MSIPLVDMTSFSCNYSYSSAEPQNRFAVSRSKPGHEVYILGMAFILILVSTAGIFDLAVTGFASTTATTGSNVTIAGYLAIALSTNLSGGIQFGTISLLPANQTNATANYANHTGGTDADDLNFTLYNVSLSTDSNQDADFCLSGSGPFATSGGANQIGLANMTWADNTTNNLTHPPQGGYRERFGQSATTSYVKGTGGLAAGGFNHYRFWLNVTLAQAAGDYNTTVNFRAVTAGDTCGS